MIYTVTLNPSLDYVVEMHGKLKVGETNRACGEHVLPGGKGINVSIMLENLGVSSVALGFVAGFTGEEIVNRVSMLGCKTDFIRLSEGMSRINVKLKGQKETEINASGPSIRAEEVEALIKKLEKLKEGDILVLAGSIPGSISKSIYKDIMRKLLDKKVLAVVDASNELLLNVLELQPFLIKPNLQELEEMFEVELKNQEDIIFYGKKLREMGARNVLISMAGDGAIFLGEDGSVLVSAAPEGIVVNSVGAGDSMVAGFLAKYLEMKDFACAFRMGIAAGSASAFSRELATKEEVMQLYQKNE